MLDITADIPHSLYLLKHHHRLFLHHLQPYHSWSVCLLQLNLNLIALCTACIPKMLPDVGTVKVYLEGSEC